MIGRLGMSNPIVEREVLTRSRSWITPVAMCVYLCLLGAVALSAFSRAVADARDLRPDAQDMAGAALLTIGLQLLLVLVFVPALTAGGIAGERERGSLDLLLLSRLRPFELGWGKLVAAVAGPVALVLLSLPLLVAVFLHAGLPLGRLAAIELVTVVTAVTLGAVANLLSALSSSTVVATASTYAAAVALYVGIPLLGEAASPGLRPGARGVHPLLFASPFYSARAAITLSSSSASVGELLHRLAGQGVPGSSGPVLQPWQVSVGAQVTLAVLCVAATGRVLSRAGGRCRPVPAGPTTPEGPAASP